jgi:Mg2+ and Co2+ transporter CorA
VDVLRVSADGVEKHDPEELNTLLGGPGVVWVDVPAWDDDAAAVLTERFGIHERAAADCARRNPVPKCTSTPATCSSSARARTRRPRPRALRRA